MMQKPNTGRRFLCRFVYLLPAISGIILLAWAMIPHLFFVEKGEAHETLTLFQLMGNTWEFGETVLSGTSENAAPAAYFSTVMEAVVVASWISIVLFAVNATVMAICAPWAHANPPTSPSSNNAKRWMRLFCFGRGWVAFTLLLPILPALFPCILVDMQNEIFVANISLHYYLVPAWIVAILLCVTQFVLFVATVRVQREEHLDMFRLYKAKR